MDPMILVPVLVVVLGLLIYLQRKGKKTTEPKATKNKKNSAVTKKTTSATAETTELEERQDAPADTVADEDWGWDTAPTSAMVAESSVEVQEVDALTEYKVYKQFGYHEKAADSLAQYLSKNISHLDGEARGSLLNELAHLWLEAKKPDELGYMLSSYASMLSKEQIEDYVKQGLALDKNNLNLRVVAEEMLGWGVQETAAEIGEKSGLDAPQAKQNRRFNRRQAEKEVVAPVVAERPRKELVRSTQRPANILVRDEEKATLMGFMKPENGYRLMKDRLAYEAAVSYVNKAIREADKPAALIIDALSLDYKNRNIDYFARHLWRLYYTLGQYGRQVKERMLGWGLNLGDNEIFEKLEANPNEVQLREIGLEYGFLEKGNNINRAQRKSLVQVRTDIESAQQSASEKILKDAESLLMYGQVEEAMDVLEEAIVEHPKESQLYITLFDICERAEEWERLEKVLHKIRANVQNPPEEVVLAMSQLLQKINYGAIRT